MPHYHSRKTGIFRKELTHELCQKFQTSPEFFLPQNLDMMLNDALDRKTSSRLLTC